MFDDGCAIIRNDMSDISGNVVLVFSTKTPKLLKFNLIIAVNNDNL